MGIINFTTRTVQGFGSPGPFDIAVRITAANDVTVTFAGSEAVGGSRLTIAGSIDRVTGDVYATRWADAKRIINYELQCRPTERMF
jgi:hypothetical protein